MISLILIVIGAFFNAFMDVLENENFHESPLTRNLNPDFWYKRVSWEKGKKIFGYRIDGWHLMKSCFIMCIFAAIVLYQPIVQPIVDFIIYGFVHNIMFGLFYHKIFKA